MSTYIISYDLRKNRDYSSLTEKIKSYGKWRKVLESLWVIVTEESASSIRDNLKTVTDLDDGIFVVKSGREAAWSNILCDNEWLKNNL